MITLTDAAANKVKSLLAAKDEKDLSLRVFVKPGGCRGFSYGMALDRATNDDQVFEEKDVRVLIDPQSAPYLKGAQIDYVDDLMGAGFKINNPNAVSTCSCGSSFRTAHGEGKPGSCC